MQFLRIAALCLLAGGIGAGAVWYGWGLVENARSVLENRRVPRAVRTEEQEAGNDISQGEPEEVLS